MGGDAQLPAELVRSLAALVIKDEAPGNRLLLLSQLCGVCVAWRHELACEVAAGLPLSFDGADGGGAHGPKATLARFRRSEVARKRATFLGASKLLHGYADVTLSGEAVTDEVLLNIAARNGGQLASVKLLAAPAVTDAGIAALARAAPRLKQLTVEDAGPGVAGAFVPVVLQACRQLEVLSIEGADAVSWPRLAAAGAWWPVLRPGHAASSDGASAAGGGAAASAPPAAMDGAAGGADGNGTGGRSGSSAAAAAAGLPQPAAGEPAAPSSSGGDGGPLQQQRRQDSGPCERSAHHRLRVSSGTSDGLLSSSDDDSDDGSSSMGAASDSTSISVPAGATTTTLALQLQHVSLQEPGGGSGGGAAAVGASARQAASRLQQQQQQQQHALQELSQQQEQQQQQRRPAQHRGAPPHTALRRLHVRFANVDSLQQLLERCPGITELQLDGPAFNIQAAAAACPGIRRLAYLVSNPLELDAALFYLNSMPSLRGLELEVKGMMLSTEQLRVVGMLPLRELALDSHAYRQQPSMPRPQYSHLDNEGVKGLVDSICSRMRTEMMPLKLSLCGATALKQEAVSALLRLPMLTAIDTGGCIKLTPMDRMRLVAKVKAGQGMLEARGGAAAGALAALRPPHAHVL